MSVRFIAVNWNRQKRIYDLTLTGAVLLALSGFVGATVVTHPRATMETALIRGLGLTALLLLHLILAIGPLARLDRRFLPLLYNRRHLGVTMAILASGHAGFAIFQYHALGDVHPLVSVLASNPGLPFELFGILALLVILLMATTSHDFWLSALTPPVWKRLHMLVYLAYLALLAHVALGLLQLERAPLHGIALGAGALTLAGLHLAAARRERLLDRPLSDAAGWADLGPADLIPEGRAIIGMVAGDRVAVFRHQGRLSAVSNVCRHQNGPLGEGRVVDGCITCPWHGYQYRPESGASPPPFNDTIPTFDLRIEDGRVLVRTTPNPPGTRVEPVPAPPAREQTASEFYVGYLPEAPDRLGRFTRRVVSGGGAAGLAIVAALGASQREIDDATFEYGNVRRFEGVVRAGPIPLLEVRASGDPGRVERYLLAGFGKHGAGPDVAALDGRSVVLEGTLAYRDRLSLIEIASVAATDARAPEAQDPTDLGTFDLEGEIVDGKCYAGVMNPGRGPTHAGCAARCLAGGLPPLFLIRDQADTQLGLLLVDSSGQPIPGLERLAALPLAVRGRVLRAGDVYFLYADPASLRRLK